MFSRSTLASLMGAAYSALMVLYLPSELSNIFVSATDLSPLLVVPFQRSAGLSFCDALACRGKCFSSYRNAFLKQKAKLNSPQGYAPTTISSLPRFP